MATTSATNPVVLESKPNYFAEMYALDVSEYIEKKNGLSYVSWAWALAWAQLKLRYPRAQYIVHENPAGWPYHTDGMTCWVKTTIVVPLPDGEAMSRASKPMCTK